MTRRPVDPAAAARAARYQLFAAHQAHAAAIAMEDGNFALAASFQRLAEIEARQARDCLAAAQGWPSDDE